jgi:hypothetical protein
VYSNDVGHTLIWAHGKLQASTPAACSSAIQTGRDGSLLICVRMQLVHIVKIFTRLVLACTVLRASLACYKMQPLTSQNVIPAAAADAMRSSLQLHRS